MTFNKGIILFVLAVLIFTSPLLGQKVYEGDYQIESLSGHTVFEYNLIDGDTIFDGSFQIDNTSLGQLLLDVDSSFSSGAAVSVCS